MTESVPTSSVRSGMIVGGKYRIESMLGEGGMGTVWAATHIELGQPVAIKLISSELARSEELLSRFKAEAKAAAALQSRYVVRMYDSGVTSDGRPYIAMEYLHGESLEDRLARVGPLSVAATVRIVSQVGKALKRAHAQGIIHRDLKPANIFLATTGDDEEVAKVLDFGIAKVLHQGADHGATATGIILGTPLYMSPEQARALKTLDHRSDLYSLGMVTYRMLVGDTPFAGESFGDLVYSICTQPLPSLRMSQANVSPNLDTWFQTACAKDQNQRFNSASDMVDALVAASGLSGSTLASSSDTGGHSLPGSLASVATGGNTGAQHTLQQGSPPTGGALARDGGLHASNTTGTASSVALGTRSGPKGSPWPVLLGASLLLVAGIAGTVIWLNDDDADRDLSASVEELHSAAVNAGPNELSPVPATAGSNDAIPSGSAPTGTGSATVTAEAELGSAGGAARGEAAASGETDDPKVTPEETEPVNGAPEKSPVRRAPRKPVSKPEPSKQPADSPKPVSDTKGKAPDMGF